MAQYDPSTYDPEARRQRYLRDRDLKGRGGGKDSDGGSTRSPKSEPTRGYNPQKPSRPPSTPPSKKRDSPSQARERIKRLQSKLASLESSLTKTLAALSKKRAAAAKSEKESSDGKSSAAEKQSAKEYREKNKQKISEKRKKEAKSSGGSSSKSVDDMSVEDLESRVGKIRDAIKSAKSQIAQAKAAAGPIKHSDDVGIDFRLRELKTRKESVLMKPADFSGWATRHDVECADGRTIRPGAFKDNHGATVPLVFQHDHKDINNVLGRVELEDRPEGVYARAYFNDTPAGQTAKAQVQHGDLKYLSIYANQLIEKARDGLSHAKDVIKGNIREVSLVLAGANPGATIEHVTLAHGDGSWTESETEAVITTVIDPIELSHADEEPEDDDEETLQDILETLSPKQEVAVNYIVAQALAHSESVEEEDSSDDEGEDSQDSQQNDSAQHDAVGTEIEAGEVQHTIQEDNSMNHNVFDSGSSVATRPTAKLSHDDLQSIVKDAKKNGSLKDAIESHLEHTGVIVNGELKHGIENIDYLFPDSTLLESTPEFLSRRMEWVDKVLGSVRKSPFSRIKTIQADITPDEARARGYIKGKMKNEEFFALSKRETTPQTVYKKQKLDRDDVIDIVNLDVVAWLKAEMKVMLDEEIAGAILIGDGRSVGDDDKIREDKIRPVATDAELYTTTAYVNLDTESGVEALVDAVIENRKHYKGTGQPTFFTEEAVISAFLTVKDNFGRRLYGNLQEVAAVLRVSEIVPVEVMERDETLVGIMVNLADYTLGADRGGQATMFDDFDIDYNKLRYLIETRLSGALVKAKAAVVFRRTAASSQVVAPTEPTFDGTTVTVATTAGVVYKNAETDATLTTASPVELAEGEELRVVAVPATGYHFSNNADDEWTFVGLAG